MRRKILYLITVFILISFSVAAQDLALKGGTILTVTKGTIENGTVVIQDGKITAVGPALLIAILILLLVWETAMRYPALLLPRYG